MPLASHCANAHSRQETPAATTPEALDQEGAATAADTEGGEVFKDRQTQKDGPEL
ncbi:hypothetical protein GCM10027395_24920 [Giesbergeria sinuosa]